MTKSFRTAAISSILAIAVAGSATGRAEPPFDPSSGWRHYPARPMPAKSAPNVLLVMTDDVGFGASSTFGGPIATPAFDRVAQAGLRYSAFHTTAMCSPTRAALLTGRNHHAVGNGAIANFSRDLDGYTSVIPDSAATIARVLRDSGYATAFFGKNHNTPEWETSAAGPFDRWPNGWGFDYFYGFNNAWANQFAPELTENRNAIPTPSDPGYILDRDLADHLIGWLHERDTLEPERPFFAYLAPGSPHTPHHAPAEWIARYKGQFDKGWDAIRAETFDRQKRAGLVPASATISPRPAELPAWDTLSAQEKRVAARMMEVYAAQLSFFDHQLGRVLNDLEASGRLDNTLVIYIQGDNGADLASLNGSANEWGAFFGEEPGLAELLPRLAELGGPTTFGGYPAAWGWAMGTPYPWGKSMAGFLGGTRVGMAMAWPDGIAAQGGIRSQFHHVIDIAPTIYEATHITPPDTVAGVKQQAIDGVSMEYSFADPKASPRRNAQYFEMMGNLGYYENGWIAASAPSRMPWDRTSPRTPLPARVEDFDWRLYDLSRDPLQARDLSADEPARLSAMVAGFARTAQANNVFPMENDVMTLLAPGQRPSLTEGRTQFRFYPRRERYNAAALPPMGTSFTVTARLTVDTDSASGPVFQQGDRFTGWGLLLDRGRPILAIRQTDRPGEELRAAAKAPLSPGAHVISANIARPANGPRTAATVTLLVDGEKVASAAGKHAGIIATHAYVGRGSGVPLVEIPMPLHCECRVEHVDVTLDR